MSKKPKKKKIPGQNNNSNKKEQPVKKNELKEESKNMKLSPEQQEDLDSYIKNKKAQADAEYVAKMNEAEENIDLQRKKMEESFEKKVEKKVAEEVEKKTTEVREKEIKLNETSESLLKREAILMQKSETYKEEQRKIIEEEMRGILLQKETIEKEKSKLASDNKMLEAKNKSSEEDYKTLLEQFKKNINVNKENELLKIEKDSLNESNEALAKLYDQINNKYEELSTKFLICGENPDKLIIENKELKKENEYLKNDLSSRPLKSEIESLNKKLEDYNSKATENISLHKAISELKMENEKLTIESKTIEDRQKIIELLKNQINELEENLNKNLELYKNDLYNVFPTLSKIDEIDFTDDMENINISMKELCDRFRGYLSNRKDTPLYYDESTIRTFIAGLASSRTMILEGLSGTGKTRLPMAFRDFTSANVEIISVQSSWKDRNDLIGYYNDFKKQYKETEFLKAIYKACCDPQHIYMIVLDEMNLSRVEYYFADFLSFLEKNEEDWDLDLISDYGSLINNRNKFPKCIHDGKLKIGNNVWFVGTANKDDSTFMISDKVYDRSNVIYFDKKGNKEKLNDSAKIYLNNFSLLRILNNGSKFVDSKEEEKCNLIIKDLDEQIKDLFDITFGNRIDVQLKKFVPAYINCGGSLEEAIDVIFANKILRKLEGVYDESTHDDLEYLASYIKEKYNMKKTLKMIERLVKNK